MNDRTLGAVEEREPAVAPRRLAPVNNALPRAAQVRRRRGFDPAHRPDAVAQANDDDDDPGKQRSSSMVIKWHPDHTLDEFDPDAANDLVDIDGKMGKKKILKLQAKAEKRQQREVNRATAESLYVTVVFRISSKK